jgi:phosphatidate phosphatase APP1
VEDAVVSRAVARLRRRHWVPRVEAYTGYGSAGWVRVLARAVLAPPGTRSAQVAERDRPVRPVRGWRSFVSVQVPFQGLQVRVEGRVHQVGADRGGYLDVVIPAALPPGWHEVEIGVDGEWVSAPVVVIGPEPRTALLSDIDDTVMVTALPRPLLAAWNALVLHEHARRAVPGMSEMFARWQDAHGDPPTFYLSTGAWNVAPALDRFLRRNGFPSGPMLLTDWGPTNTDLFRSGRVHKREAMRRLMAELPQLSWTLVGDDGQHDPYLYAEAVAEHPGRVEAVVIRRLTPAEQVLSHGIPLPLRQAEADDAPHVAVGADGHELVRRLVDAGLLPPIAG